MKSPTCFLPGGPHEDVDTDGVGLHVQLEGVDPGPGPRVLPLQGLGGGVDPVSQYSDYDGENFREISLKALNTCSAPRGRSLAPSSRTGGSR